MSFQSPHLLSNIFSTKPTTRSITFHGAIPLKSRDDSKPFDDLPPQKRRRTAIWDMHHSVHCSIIGTCLSPGELRRLLIKMGLRDAEDADDHTLHKQAVTLAGRPRDGAKFIQKALDRRHEAAIRDCARLKDEAALIDYWGEALKRGDIPGAYWAVLSHPEATDAVMRRAFGDVHMLSHLVGAANRADIRRLRQLEDENAALAEKNESQQRQLCEGFKARDEKIRQFTDALSRALTQAPPRADQTHEDTAAAKSALIDCAERLERETLRRQRLESRLDEARRIQSESARQLQTAEADISRLSDEVARLESHLAAVLGTDGNDTPAAAVPALNGLIVLYVGGRANQIPQFRAMVERAGGLFLHHDGGIEHSMTLLPGLVGKAECTTFPIDCISHDAMGTIKRLCRNSGRPFLPLRSSGLGSLVAGLAALTAVSPIAEADRH